MKAAIVAASLMPFSRSTPLLTSTAQGLTRRTASVTFSTVSPPASTIGSGKPEGIRSQSNRLPVPPWLPSTKASNNKPLAAR